jgi:tRNA(Ile)-lysidine synthase
MYHGAVQSLAQRVTAYIVRHKLLKPGDRVGVAVSGGADSVALLRLLLELRSDLGIILSVVHFNHKLRGMESDQDEQFVAELATRHKLQFHHSSADVRGYASEEKLSIEAAARKLRHGLFSQLILESKLDKVATAHTADDQAETVLLRIVRGTGLHGLAAIWPSITVHDAGSEERGLIVRPLLNQRRSEVLEFLKAIGQRWREDSTNADLRFTRNRVRKLLIPMLEGEFNPAIIDRLSEISEIARGEEEFWQLELKRLGSDMVKWILPESKPGPREVSIDLHKFARLPLGVQRRILHQLTGKMGIPADFKHIEEVLQLLQDKPHSARHLRLPADWQVERIRNELQFRRPFRQRAPIPADYEYRLRVPGKVTVWEAEVEIEALFVSDASSAGYNSGILLDPRLLAKELTVRNWRAGDRFWPVHTKTPHKIKELLQRQRVSRAERKSWPVIASGTDIIWVKGLAAPTQLQPSADLKPLIVIRHVPIKPAGKNDRNKGESVR